jgi:drug/metabolite transporter (DMT)-like permease
VVFARGWRDLAKIPKEAVWIGLAAGWTNLSYVLAVLSGEVMRVLLLFYLAPLWTLLFARLILGERTGKQGLMVMGFAVGGMLTMLWQGAASLPVPQSSAEWLALSAGIGFAIANVLTRWAGHITLKSKSFSVWAGVCVISLAFFLFETHPLQPLVAMTPEYWLLIIGMGGVLAITTWLVQFGLTHTPANKAAVIFMFELVVAALSSYWLADEALSLREWVGGAMIVGAAFYSERIAQTPQQ